uniref:DUF3800 domain-containing protein n=1 Tax=Panagrellus redivivus TaxID=6233 RepID=A0A7E4UY21_PANRE
MCFDYVINPKDTIKLTNVAINIVSRLLHWIRLARPDASIEKAITVLMFFMWEHDDPKIDQDQIKNAVANSPEVIEAIAQLHQSTGPTCVIAIDFGCVRGTKTPTELICVELPRNL